MECMTYLTFDGNCPEAMKFYEKCLGAELHMMPFPRCRAISKEAKDRIMHARLTKGPAVLMASDTMPRMPFDRGKNNFSVSMASEKSARDRETFCGLQRKQQGRYAAARRVLGRSLWNAHRSFGVNWMFNSNDPNRVPRFDSPVFERSLRVYLQFRSRLLSMALPAPDFLQRTLARQSGSSPASKCFLFAAKIGSVMERLCNPLSH